MDTSEPGAFASEIQTLLDKADDLDDGRAKALLLEEAIRLADAARDESLGYKIRKDALWSLYYADRFDSLLVHFAWCLGYVDRHPELFRGKSPLLEEYRWVLDAMPQFDEIPLTRIHECLADMARRFVAAGYSLRAVHVLRNRVACQIGDRAMAEDAFAAIDTAERDDQADSKQTEAAFRVYHFIFLKDEAAAITAAKPFLDKRYTDPEFQIGVFDNLLIPLTHAGRLDEARKWQKHTTKLINARPEHLGGANDHIEFLAVIGDLAAAVRMFAQHFAAGIGDPGVSGRFYVCRATRFLMERLTKAGQELITFRPPDGLFPVADGRCRVADILGWATCEAAAIAARLDARNGNDFYSVEIAALSRHHQLTDSLSPSGGS